MKCQSILIEGGCDSIGNLWVNGQLIPIEKSDRPEPLLGVTLLIGEDGTIFAREVRGSGQ